MTFIVTLIALLIERFFDWSHLRYWRWYEGYQQWIAQKAPQKQSYILLLLAIIPILLVVALVQFSLRYPLYGLIELIFQLAIVLYCLGPQSLWADTFACINALTSNDAQAKEKLKMQMGVTENESTSLHQLLLDRIFIEANRRVFAPIFWFVVIGPVGIVLYRLISQSAQAIPHEGKISETSPAAHIYEAALDWVPLRVMTFLFALGGHFAKVFNVYRKHVGTSFDGNETLLVECGNAALGGDEKIMTDGSTERSAVSLLDRTFVIFLILVAIVVWVM